MKYLIILMVMSSAHGFSMKPLLDKSEQKKREIRKQEKRKADSISKQHKTKQPKKLGKHQVSCYFQGNIVTKKIEMIKIQDNIIIGKKDGKFIYLPMDSCIAEEL